MRTPAQSRPRLERASRFRELGTGTFDVLVIGGGINGAGIARDAAMRGLRTALVEKDDFASGTSSRSSRLIHGGVRYLEHAQLGLVRESVRERETLLRIAPGIVHSQEFTWPVYAGSRIPLWKLRAGLSLYDLLARGSDSENHHTLSPAEVAEHEPSLRRDSLRGGCVYSDARANDARLTLANVLSATAAGALTLNHAEALRPLSRDRDEWLAIVCDPISGDDVEVRARIVVNATGPWRLDLERRGRDRSAPKRRGTKGVHVTVPRARIANRGAVTLLSPADGRVMFVLPFGEQALIGTTDTWTEESPDEVRPAPEDIEYLLASVNAYFPEAKLERSDVVTAWAGIRPLATMANDRAPSRVSREHAIVRSEPGVITVTGGKLTTYRVVAADVVDEVQRDLGRKRKRAPTDDQELPGTEREEALRRLIQVEPELATPVVPGSAHTLAELRYAVEEELAWTLSDLLMRRTGVAFEHSDAGRAAAEAVANTVGEWLNWSDEWKKRRIDAYLSDATRVFGVPVKQ
jgi:glycerol-3-phosphate dehydrogenase